MAQKLMALNIRSLELICNLKVESFSFNFSYCMQFPSFGGNKTTNVWQGSITKLIMLTWSVTFFSIQPTKKNYYHAKALPSLLKAIYPKTRFTNHKHENETSLKRKEKKKSCSINRLTDL